MLSLLRRDPTMRMVPKWILVGAMTSSVIAGIRAWIVASRALESDTLVAAPRFGDLLLLSLALWVPLAILLAFGRTGQRCSRFDLVMPLAGSRLFTVHLLGVFVSGALVLAASAGVIALHERVLSNLPRYASGEGRALWSLVLITAVGMGLVATILQSTQPSVYRVQIDKRRRLFVLGMLVFGLALILGLGSLPLATLVAPIVIALVLTVRNYRAVPAALTIVPHAPDEAVDHGRRESWSELRDSIEASGSGTPGSWRQKLRLDASVFRILMLGIAPGQMLRLPVNVIAFPFLFGMGMLLSGLVIRYDVLRFTNIALTVYMLVAFIGGPMVQLYILDPLPISRRRIFALMMLPNLLAVALGYGAGRLGLAQLDPQPLLAYGTEASRQFVPQRRAAVGMVRVPKEEFAIAWDGRPPQNTSPWGEAHEAWRIPLFKGSRAVIYSPYSTGEDCSAEFVALQISRAVEAIYGESISFEEIRDRYLETNSDGDVVLKSGRGLSLLSDYPELETRGEGPVFPVVMLLTALFWFLLASIYFRIQRASTSERARKAAFFGVLGAALAVHLAQFFAFIAGLVEDWVAVGMLELTIRWLVEELPGGNLAVWFLCFLLFAAGYRLTRAAFERVEVAVSQPRQEA